MEDPQTNSPVVGRAAGLPQGTEYVSQGSGITYESAAAEGALAAGLGRKEKEIGTLLQLMHNSKVAFQMKTGKVPRFFILSPDLYGLFERVHNTVYQATNAGGSVGPLFCGTPVLTHLWASGVHCAE